MTAIPVPSQGVQPHAQVDDRGRTHVIYFGGDPKRGDVFYVRSDDDCVTFTAPIRVNSHPGSAIAIGTIRGPHLALGRGGRPHVAWMGSDKAEPKGKGGTAPMLYTRLNDAGNAFEPERNVIQNHPGLDGGGSVAADDKGNVYVAWHAPAGGGDRAGRGRGHGHDEQDRQVWVTRSQDDGVSFDPEVAAIAKGTGVCACCGLSIAAQPDGGGLFIAFRSAKEMVHRDVHVLHSKDHGRTFDVVTVDPWRVATCVMSTTAFARHDDVVVAAWETTERVQVARFAKGEVAAKPQAMPGEGKSQKHPAIAVNATGETLIAWAEGTGWNKGGVVAWQILDGEGRPISGRSGRRDGLKPWSRPAVTATKAGGFTIIF